MRAMKPSILMKPKLTARAEAAALAVPTVHLNGTSKECLMADLRRAHEAVEAALEALRQTAPHRDTGRDYYIQGSTAFLRAQDQHSDRVRRLSSVSKELLSIAEGIHDQGK
jgi:hypothetical protein